MSRGPIALLKIRDLPLMPPGENKGKIISHKDVAAWLRKQADAIEEDGAKFADRYTARIDPR